MLIYYWYKNKKYMVIYICEDEGYMVPYVCIINPPPRSSVCGVIVIINSIIIIIG